MFIDASAIVAILNQEPGCEHVAERIKSGSGKCFTSAIARFEVVTSIARVRAGQHQTPTAEDIAIVEDRVTRLLDGFEVRDITITPTIGDRALKAAQTYGRHVGHPAKLNLGDCFAYACASAYNISLVYVGDDFTHTDLA